MPEDTALIEKREELKRQLAAGEYKTLVNVILDGTGRLIQKLTRNPEPISFWYSGVVTALVALSVGFFTSILLGESIPTEALLAEIFFVAGLGLSCMLALRKFEQILLTTLSESILDAIESVGDLNDLKSWLAANLNIKKQVFSSLVLGPLMGLFAGAVWVTIKGYLPGFGPAILAIVFGFQMVVTFVMGPSAYTFTARLSQYQLKLYAADPSSSETIDRVSDMMNSLVFTFALIAVILTFGFVLFRLLTLATAIFLIPMVWVPIIGPFVIIQYYLAKIVTRAKWKTLNEIQAKVEKLQAQEDIPSEETLAHLGKLMDYHDRIRATPNSALNLRAGLNFLNSLLLPLIAFLLANIEKVIEFFAK